MSHTDSRAQLLGITGSIREGYSHTWPLWARNAWTVTLKSKDGKRLRIGFFNGGANLTPTIDDVLECIALDAQLGALSLEDFADSIGLNADSVKDRATWRGCRSMRSRAQRWLGDDFDLLVSE